MKLSKFLISIILINIALINIILALKSKKYHCKLHSKKSKHTHRLNNKSYDENYSPSVIKEFLNFHIDTSLDAQKMLNTCLDLISNSVNYDLQRKEFWTDLEKFALDTKVTIGFDEVKAFLKNVNPDASNPTDPSKKIECGKYTIGCLKQAGTINSSGQIEGARQLLSNSMGTYYSQAAIKNSNLITSFASYNRDSKLRHPDLFKRLNGNARLS
jgi:hypothetical protein